MQHLQFEETDVSDEVDSSAASVNDLNYSVDHEPQVSCKDAIIHCLFRSFMMKHKGMWGPILVPVPEGDSRFCPIKCKMPPTNVCNRTSTTQCFQCMYHPIAFHSEFMGEIMYLHQALKQDDSAELKIDVFKKVNDHTDQKHWKLI